jgi:hypothetical protein
MGPAGGRLTPFAGNRWRWTENRCDLNVSSGGDLARIESGERKNSTERAICRWAWKGSLFRHFWRDMTDNLAIVGGSLPRSTSIPWRGKNRATNKGRST